MVRWERELQFQNNFRLSQPPDIASLPLVFQYSFTLSQANIAESRDIIIWFHNPNLQVSDAFSAAIWKCTKVSTIVKIGAKVNRK